jgi:hypothetical protein
MTMASKKSESLTLLEASSADADRRIARLTKSLDDIALELEQLPELDEDTRTTSIGKLRDGEDDAIVHLCNAIDAFPHYFASIADKDRGTDDSKVETQPTRDAIARRKLLKGIADRLTGLTSRINDAVLVLGSDIRSVSIAAYRVAQTNAANDTKLRSKLAKVTAFYGESAKKAKVTRKNKKAGKG